MRLSFAIRRRLAIATILTLTACAAPAATAPTATIAKPTGKLSARLEILANSSAQSVQEQARALNLPVQGPGSLRRDVQGRLLVTIRMSSLDPDQLQALRDAGAMITNVAEPYRSVTAFAAPADLTAIAHLATVENVQEELTPLNRGVLVPTPP